MNPRRRALLGAAFALPWALARSPGAGAQSSPGSLSPGAQVPGAPASTVPASTPPAKISAMRFSALKAGDTLPADLRPWSFAGGQKPTRYSLVEDEGVVVLRADAAASTSGIARELKLDPRALPLLSWRWKVLNVVAGGDLRTKAGDDFAARVYVTFDLDTATLSAGERMQLGMARLVYGDKVPAAALCYVWDGKASRDTSVPNAYTGRVHMVVAEGGTARVGQWVGMRRDVRADYRRAFGAEPPAVTGVIVSTDTDNTGETAVAFYGDISFGSRPP
ncbi:MAG: DUF3047 domain-containing protein [Betaproteobacteria bacterium]